MIYHSDPMKAIDQARNQLRLKPGERHIIRTERGYRVINPRETTRHYGVVAARMTYARKPDSEQHKGRSLQAWQQVISQQRGLGGDR